MTTIRIKNPWSGAYLDKDITGLTQLQLDAYAGLMDDDLREELHDQLAPCTPEVFLAAWVDRVGQEEAGSIILGS